LSEHDSEHVGNRAVRWVSEKLSFTLALSGVYPIMRISTLFASALVALLAGCASNQDALLNKEVAQTGPLKVHPGLVEKAGPAQTVPAAGSNQAPAESSGEAMPKALPASSH